MRMFSKFTIVVFLLLALTFSSWGSIQVMANVDTNDITIPPGLPPRTTPTSVVVYIDPRFDEGIDFQDIASQFEGPSLQNYGAPYRGEHDISVEVRYLSSLQIQETSDYFASIADTDGPNGHEFNETAFANGEVNVFPAITGVSIDAEEALDFVINNLWDGTRNQYSLFVFNFTSLDEQFGAEHWFNTYPVDMDSNNTVTSFFSARRGLDYGRQTAGWGGRQDAPVFFVDLSARTWYGQWVETAWGYTDGSAHVKKNLADFGSPVDVQDPAFVEWITRWLQDYIYNLFYEPQWFVNAPAESYSFQIIVAENWTGSGYSEEQIKWILHEQAMSERLRDAFPYMNFTFDIQWKTLDDFPELRTAIESDMSWNTAENRYDAPVDGLLGKIESGLGTYFDFGRADVVLPSFAFLLPNNVVFNYNGFAIAGLGGMGWQLLGVQPQRTFKADGVTKERGLGLVTLHEIGHSLGLPHPFNEYGGWSTDFTASIMGYFSNNDQFGIIPSNTVGRYFSDHYLVQAEWLYDELRDAASAGDLNENQTTALPIAFDLLTNAQAEQLAWDYANAVPDSKLALSALIAIANDTSLPPSITDTNTTSSLTNNSSGDTEGGFLDIAIDGSIVGLLVAAVPLLQRRLKKQ